MDKFNGFVATLKEQEAAGLAKAGELLNAGKKLAKLQKKEEEEQKKNNTIVIVIGIVMGLIVIAGIAYALYRYFTPDYLDDFEDDLDDEFDDDFDDDFFEGEPSKTKA